MTLIELLVAASILTVGAAGLLSAWIYAVRRSQQTATETAANECARLVMERARSLSYVAPPGTLPMNSSSWVGDGSSRWQSPSLQAYKYFDSTLSEIGSSDTAISPPAGSAFLATTTMSYLFAQAPVQKPVGRDDLDQLTINVSVQQVDSQGALSAPLANLTAVVSIGGL